MMKNKLNRRIIIISMAALLIIVLFGAAIAFDASGSVAKLFFAQGQLYRRIENGSEIMATVNGEPIYRADVERTEGLNKAIDEGNRLYAEANYDEEMLREFYARQTVRPANDALYEHIYKKVMLLDADKQKITATDDEIAAAIAENKQIGRDNPDELAIKIFNEYIAGLGMTAEDYYATYAWDVFKTRIIKSKHFAYYIESHPETKAMSHGDIVADYDEYIKELSRQYDIVIK